MSQQIILSVGRSRLRISRVEGNARATNIFESEWSAQNIDAIFEKLHKAIGNHSVRVLLDDDISYVFSETVPDDIETERSWLLSRIQERIPEQLNNANWDFRELKKVPGGRQVIVFAPNESVWTTLYQAAVKSGMTIEAVEPVLIASKRHTNPVIGLALKQDIRGDDAKVLNITSTREFDVNEEKKQAPVRLSVLVIILIVALAIGAAGVVFLMKNKSKTVIVTPKPSVQSTVTATPTATSSATPTTIQKNLPKYAVQVLNGSGIEGEAGRVAGILTAEGFTEAATGNAVGYTYTDTQVQQKADVPAYVYETIDRALNGDYTLRKGEPLTTNDNYDVLIIVGRKK